MRVFAKLLGGRPMFFMHRSFFDPIGKFWVNVYVDKLGRYWLASSRWSAFRVPWQAPN